MFDKSPAPAPAPASESIQTTAEVVDADLSAATARAQFTVIDGGPDAEPVYGPTPSAEGDGADLFDHRMNAMSAHLETKSLTIAAIVFGVGIAVSLYNRHKHREGKKS